MDEQRGFEGAWITPLPHHATENGYTVLRIFEIHHFPKCSCYDPTTKSGGIFAEFILALIRKKVITSEFLLTSRPIEKKLHIVKNTKQLWQWC